MGRTVFDQPAGSDVKREGRRVRVSPRYRHDGADQITVYADRRACSGVEREVPFHHAPDRGAMVVGHAAIKRSPSALGLYISGNQAKGPCLRPHRYRRLRVPRDHGKGMLPSRGDSRMAAV
ncbi:MAG: hypothetical protein AMXMBFR76_11500 [Pseudomonadota bacterium]